MISNIVLVRINQWTIQTADPSRKKRIFGDGFLHQEWTPDSHCDGVENRE